MLFYDTVWLVGMSISCMKHKQHKLRNRFT